MSVLKGLTEALAAMVQIPTLQGLRTAQPCEYGPHFWTLKVSNPCCYPTNYSGVVIL